MNKVACITINTDASYCGETGASGYAFYAICDNFKIMKSGNFKKKPKTPTEAEVFAFANAVYTVSRQKELPKSNFIIVNTDCMWVVNSMNKDHIKHINGRVGGGKQAKVILNTLKNACETSIENVIVRHVKAHSGVQDARSWVNNWCDQEAKKWMVKERQVIKMSKKRKKKR